MSAGQRRGLMYLLGLFKDKKLNTRSPELRASSGAHDPFVEELRTLSRAAKPTPPRKRGQITLVQKLAGSRLASQQRMGGAGDGTESGNGPGKAGAAGAGTTPQGNGTESGGAAQPGSRGPNRGETRSRLDLDGFVYRGSSPGLRRRFEELQRLDVRDFPNATHDLLRTILECAIKDYFAGKGQPLPAGKMLGSCIEELAREYQNDRRMTSLINAINRRGSMSAQQFSGTASSLNASNHEPDSFVTGREVHEAWERMKPILVDIVGK